MSLSKVIRSPAGLTLFYLLVPIQWFICCVIHNPNFSWNITTAIILLNVLISLFSSAYSDVGNPPFT